MNYQQSSRGSFQYDYSQTASTQHNPAPAFSRREENARRAQRAAEQMRRPRRALPLGWSQNPDGSWEPPRFPTVAGESPDKDQVNEHLQVYQQRLVMLESQVRTLIKSNAVPQLESPASGSSTSAPAPASFTMSYSSCGGLEQFQSAAGGDGMSLNDMSALPADASVPPTPDPAFMQDESSQIDSGSQRAAASPADASYPCDLKPGESLEAYIGNPRYDPNASAPIDQLPGSLATISWDGLTAEKGERLYRIEVRDPRKIQWMAPFTQPPGQTEQP